SLVDRGLDLFQRIVERTVVGHQLNDIDAVIDVLANRFAHLFGSVGIDVFVTPEGPLFGWNRRGLPAEGSDDLACGQDGWAIEHSGLDRATNVFGRVTGVIAELTHGRKSGAQEVLGVPQSAQAAIGGGLLEVKRLEGSVSACDFGQGEMD